MGKPSSPGPGGMPQPRCMAAAACVLGDGAAAAAVAAAAAAAAAAAVAEAAAVAPNLLGVVAAGPCGRTDIPSPSAPARRRVLQAVRVAGARHHHHHQAQLRAAACARMELHAVGHGLVAAAAQGHCAWLVPAEPRCAWLPLAQVREGVQAPQAGDRPGAPRVQRVQGQPAVPGCSG